MLVTVLLQIWGIFFLILFSPLAVHLITAVFDEASVMDGRMLLGWVCCTIDAGLGCGFRLESLLNPPR